MRNVCCERALRVFFGFLPTLALLQACARETPREDVGDAGAIKSYTPGELYMSEIPGYPPTGATCSVAGSKEAKLEQGTELGFSGVEVLAMFNKQAHGDLEWADGHAAQISFHATSSAETVSYMDAPKDRGLCAPTLSVPLDEVTVQSSDGLIDARIVSTPDDPLELIGSTDGDGGIGMIFPLRFWADPASFDSQLLRDAEADHLDYDQRRVAVEFSMSSGGRKSQCIAGEEVSGDPAKRCNIYDGVLRYDLMMSAGLANHHDIPPGTFYEAPLGTWFWNR